MLETYYRFCRPASDYIINDHYVKRGRPEHRFFVTTSGKGISSADLRQGMVSAWQHAGLGKKIGTCLLRKTVTTKVHSNNPELRDPVARHLTHLTSSAEASYKATTRSKQSVETSKVIYATLTSDDKLGLGLPNVAAGSSNTNVSFFKESNVEKRGPGQATFNTHHRNIIKEAFQVFIDSNARPSMKAIHAIINERNLLQYLPEGITAVQIKGCVYGMLNKKNRELSIKHCTNLT